MADRPEHTALTTTRTIEEICARLRVGTISRSEFVEECARFVSQQVGCTRVGLWVFVESRRGRLMHCVGMYDSALDQMRQVPDECEEKVRPFFYTLDRLGYVLANDVHTHPATSSFFAEPPQRASVRSLMAAAFSLNGKIYGALTCANLGQPMHWSPQQIAILRHCGSKATLALAEASPKPNEFLWAPLD